MIRAARHVLLCLAVCSVMPMVFAQAPPDRPRPPPGAPPPPPGWHPGDPLPPPPPPMPPPPMPPVAREPPGEQAWPIAGQRDAAPLPTIVEIEPSVPPDPAPPVVEREAAQAAPAPAPAPAAATPAPIPAIPTQPAPAAPDPVAPASRNGGWFALLAILGTLAAWWWWRRSHALAEEAQQLVRQQRALKSANSRLQDESQRLREQATNDPLTGALNRQAFGTALRELLEHVGHYNRAAWLAVIDLDHFKAINDSLGHLAGDSALKLVTGIAREHLVSADLFGRFGGDEFLIGMADHDEASALQLAEGLRIAVADAARQHQPPLTGLSLSIGLACADAEIGYSADALFARADAALYRAKHLGRNRVVVADAALAAPSMPAARHL